MKHGLEEVGYGFWGFSPRQSAGRIPGLWRQGSGHLCPGLLLPRDRATCPAAPGALVDGVGSHGRHAARLVPGPATHRTRQLPISALAVAFPIYSTLGFQDSVDVSVGVVAGSILTLDQGMIMAAIANVLADDACSTSSATVPSKRIRPLIAVEEFSTGPPGQLVGVQPAVKDGHEHEFKSKSVRFLPGDQPAGCGGNHRRSGVREKRLTLVRPLCP